MGQIIAYARVSKDEQELDRQLFDLEQHGYDKLIQEKYTGTKKDREGIERLLDIVREGDIVVVESISRLGRNTLDILNLIQYFEEKGIVFKSLKESMLDTTTPTGKAMVGMVAVIAQLERDMTAQRTKEGLAAAKRRGSHIGRPKVDEDRLKTALKMYDSGDYSVKEIVTTLKIGQGTLYKAINKRKLKS